MMGFIRFSTEGHEDVNIGAGEWHRFNRIVNDITWASFRAINKMETLKKGFVNVSYIHEIHETDKFIEAIRINLAVTHVGRIRTDKNVSFQPFALNLNTASAIGGDVVKFIARIVGQCELHVYIEPVNSEWIISIINKGLNSRLFNKDAGWLDLIDLLERTKHPIVTSYSVSDWWEGSVDELRKSSEWLEIKPDTFQDYYFDNGITAGRLIDLLEKG